MRFLEPVLHQVLASPGQDSLDQEGVELAHLALRLVLLLRQLVELALDEPVMDELILHELVELLAPQF